MAAPFPYPPSNMTGVVGLMNHANNLLDGFFGVGILIFIGIISFISTKNFSTERSFGVTMFITFIIGLLFRFMNLISSEVFYIIILLLVGDIVWLVTTRDNESM